jgi:hypothetical protein
MIELGMSVKDKITGLTGVAVARTEYLTGCARISVQPTEVKDGKTADWVTLDEGQLDIIKTKKKIVLNEIKAATPRQELGGPQPTVEKW